MHPTKKFKFLEKIFDDKNNNFPDVLNSCTPSSPATFLFAYSTDLAPQVIFDTFSLYSPLYAAHYSKLANVRFDLWDPEQIEYHSTFAQWNNSIYSHLPNPSLGHNSSGTGSDVVWIIDSFLENTEAPVCGSAIMIFLKRYPNKLDNPDIVAKLQKHNVFLHVVTALNPSGGHYSGALYDIATRTNGFCIFEMDTKFQQAASWFAALNANPYLIYAANANVSGTGSILLPPLTSQYVESCLLLMTVQDYGVLNASFQSIALEWKAPGNNASVYQNHATLGGFKNGNFFGTNVIFNATTYNTTLKYNYTSMPQTLQIRIFSRHVTDYWPPYF